MKLILNLMIQNIVLAVVICSVSEDLASVVAVADVSVVYFHVADSHFVRVSLSLSLSSP